jgi:hypothetical protein
MPDLSMLPSDILRALALKHITEADAWHALEAAENERNQHAHDDR